MSEKINTKNDVVHSKPSVDDKLTNLAEFGLDQIFDAGLCKDVPAIATILGFAKTVQNVRDYCFQKKLVSFLVEFNKHTEHERLLFCARFEKDKHRNKLAEALLFLLDRIDSEEKSKMISRSFCAYLKQEINRDELERLWNAIDKIYCGDIQFLKKMHTSSKRYIAVEHCLASCGLVIPTPAKLFVGVNSGPDYKVSELGELFLKICS